MMKLSSTKLLAGALGLATVPNAHGQYAPPSPPAPEGEKKGGDGFGRFSRFLIRDSVHGNDRDAPRQE